MANPQPYSSEEPILTLGVALDHVRTFHSRVVKPFAKLEEVLEYASGLAGTIAAAEQKLAELKTQTEREDRAATQRLAALHEEIRAAEKLIASVRPKAAEADQAIARAENAVQQAERKHAAAMRSMEEDAKRREAEITKNHEAVLASLARKEREAMDRLDAVKRQVAELAAKLGG